MGNTKKPAARRPAGKKATPANGRTTRKVQKARKPRSDKGAKVAKVGAPAPQHVVLQPVPLDRPMPSFEPPRVTIELDDTDIRAARALKWLGIGLVIVVLAVAMVAAARAAL